MNTIVATRRTVALVIPLAFAATAAPTSAQERFENRPSVYGYYSSQGFVRRSPNYRPDRYAYGAGFYGYRGGFVEQEADNLPAGTGAWWRAMDKENRGGNPNGGP